MRSSAADRARAKEAKRAANREKFSKLQEVETDFREALKSYNPTKLLWEVVSDKELRALLRDDEEGSGARPNRMLDLARESFFRRASKIGKVEIVPVTPWPRTAGVYFMRVHDRVKIGVAKNVAARLESFQTASPFETHLLAVEPGDRQREAALHREFANDRVKGEWFRISQPLLTHIAKVRGLTVGW